MKFILIVIALLVLASAAIPFVLKAWDIGKKIKMWYSVIPIAISFALMIFAFSFEIIPTGYTGVLTTNGQISEKTLQNGWNWKAPIIQSIKLVNNKQQDITFSGQVWSETKERTSIAYDNVTVTYQINPEKSAWIYRNVSNYESNLISGNIVSSAVKSSSKTLSDVDATNRSVTEPLVADNLQASLDQKYGKSVVIINKVIVKDANFDESYNRAIADKQKAQLAAEKQEIENQKNIEKAKADAEVKKTKAKATAEANKIIRESLTKEVLQSKYLDKWNGKLPTYLGGENESVMFGIN